MTLEQFTKIVRKRLRNDYDVVIAITGSTGEGKSTCALWLGDGIDNNFDLEKNISFFPDPKNIIKEYSKLKKYSVYILDEAIRATHKHDWQSKLQQSLVKMFNTERWQNKCTILCIPNFWDLAKSFRNDRVKIWIHIWKRGTAYVYIKDIDKDAEDVWHLEETKKKKKKMFSRKKILDLELDKRLAFERKLPTFYCEFKFPDLPEEVKNKYLDLKIKSREGMLDGEQEKDPLWRMVSKNCIWDMKINQKKKNKEIAVIGGCSERSVNNLIREKRDELKRKQVALRIGSSNINNNLEALSVSDDNYMKSNIVQ